MWPVSDRFMAALSSSHQVVSRVDVYRSGVLLLSDLPISDGSVTVDESSRVRRSCSITVADTSLAPKDSTDLLAPVGTELAVFSGIGFADGSTELVPLGVFRIISVSTSEWNGEVTVEAQDRTSALANDRFLTPRTTPATTGYVDEIAAMVHGTLPAVDVIDITGSTATLSDPATWDRDRDAAIESLADSIGAEAFFDVQGSFVVRPVVSIPADPDAAGILPNWTVASGETGVLVDVAGAMSAESVYNGVVVTGVSTSSATAAPYATAKLTSGPFRWDGPFGRKPLFVSNSLIYTKDQALTAAKARLARLTALQRTLTPTTLPNPALDVGDVLKVVLPDGSWSWQVVSGLSVPLSASSMSITVRSVGDTDEESTDA